MRYTKQTPIESWCRILWRGTKYDEWSEGIPTVGNERRRKRNVIIFGLMIGGFESHIVLGCLCMNVGGRNLSCCRSKQESIVPLFLF